MKPDESIDTVLNALGTSEPPQGYETRIHNALRHAAAEQQRSITFHNRHAERSAAKSKSVLPRLTPRMPWAIACAAVLFIGIAIWSHRHTQPTLQSGEKKVATSNVLLPDAPITTTRSPSHTKQVLASRSTSAEKHNKITQPQRIEVAIETHEYIPEPPLPLTEQERLVLRMMRRNTAQQLAEYTPDARTLRLHEDAQAYRDYFAAKPLEGQPFYVQTIDHQ